MAWTIKKVIACFIIITITSCSSHKTYTSYYSSDLTSASIINENDSTSTFPIASNLYPNEVLIKQVKRESETIIIPEKDSIIVIEITKTDLIKPLTIATVKKVIINDTSKTTIKPLLDPISIIEDQPIINSRTAIDSTKLTIVKLDTNNTPKPILGAVLIKTNVINHTEKKDDSISTKNIQEQIINTELATEDSTSNYNKIITPFKNENLEVKEKLKALNQMLALEIVKTDSLSITKNNISYFNIDTSFKNSYIEVSKKLDSLTQLSIKNKELTLIDSISLFFNINDYRLNSTQEKKIKTIIEKNALISTNKMLIIKGFTDKTGSQNYNDYLSYLRADEVKKQLIKENVNTNKTYLMNFGKSYASENLIKDRRVELLIYKE